ncbi:regulatory protein RecX [Thorsellia anophelis]|uniref:Regulatory protein RecX n=1 Tax=Thorsellia anophelis DSM 18579 TaxID=1123402 RepID=A0A1H9YSN8_9GAMM|nr:regulatory protein RecX [Thorsellia anophelis]SES72180.1 regulatory protein [Thorsellia anophelis DSM 18579]
MTTNPFSALLLQAQYYLSKRDHGRVELMRKLTQFILKKESSHTNRWQNKKCNGEDIDSEFRDDLTDDFSFSSQQHHLSESQYTLIESVLEYCAEHNWLNDSRFTERYIENRHKKGIGKSKLKSELYQKGIDKTLINTLIESAEIDWFALAQLTAHKKYPHLLEDRQIESKLKIQRFLQSRGFSFEEINAIFDE